MGVIGVCIIRIDFTLPTLFDDGVVKREDIFITSKLWNDHHAYQDVPDSLDNNKNLQLQYLNIYIVPHVEVLKRVSSILTDHGFYPTGESIETENLRPYNCKIAERDFNDKGMAHLDAVVGKAVRKIAHKGWDPTYTRRSYFPYWRSVLGARCHVRVYPSYAAAADRFIPNVEQIREQIHNSWSKPVNNGLSPITNPDLSWVQRIRLLTTNFQPKRFFGTAAVTLFSGKVPVGKRLHL